MALGNLQFCFPIGNTLGKVPSEDMAFLKPENAFAVEQSGSEPSGVDMAYLKPENAFDVEQSGSEPSGVLVALVTVRVEFQSSLSVHLAIFPAVLVDEGL